MSSGTFAQMIGLKLAIAALVLGLSGHAQAASLRCDKALLQEGAHMYEVNQLCGAPVAEYSRIEFLHPDVAVYVDEWVYRLGKNKFERMLRFENGRLRNIRTLRKPVMPQASFRGRSTNGRGENWTRDTDTVHRISY